MRLIVQDAPALKAAIDSIVCLVEEGQFEIKDDGLYFRAMDPSQISMVSFKMPKEAFVEYGVPEEMKLGVDIGQLSNVLSGSDSFPVIIFKARSGCFRHMLKLLPKTLSFPWDKIFNKSQASIGYNCTGVAVAISMLFVFLDKSNKKLIKLLGSGFWFSLPRPRFFLRALWHSSQQQRYQPVQ